jgi:hypothetical protein
VDGSPGRSELEAVASSLADACLVGWDTGGEAWES